MHKLYLGYLREQNCITQEITNDTKNQFLRLNFYFYFYFKKAISGK